jgi:hypothetical protein
VTDSSVPGAERRRVYRSTPGRPSLASLRTEFDQVASRVYAGLRDGALEAEATFDLACFLIDWGPFSPAVQDLAEQSVAETDRARLADLAACWAHRAPGVTPAESALQSGRGCRAARLDPKRRSGSAGLS